MSNSVELRSCLLFASAMALVACGGGKPAAAPSMAEPGATVGAPEGGKEESDAQENEDPKVAFEKAEKRLDELFGGAGEPDAGVPAPADERPTPMTDPEDEGEEISSLSKNDRCTVACKALASMERSADQVCEMTGEGDSRCESLRERVERAKSLVQARCPQCAAARP
jgi:hypothetical protein